MTKQLSDCLNRYRFPKFENSWGDIRRGIEKESLRVTADGQLSLLSHPIALGSALTNPFITTDFSEALLEMITPVSNDVNERLQVLGNIHQFTSQNISENDMLWATSMPCPLKNNEEIPIAQYGSSNIGKLKTLYRNGLHHRYGSTMQAVAGIHYNFSMPEVFWESYKDICNFSGSIQEFRTQKYLHLIRNFHRNSWLLIYLFGASPSACKSFVNGREHNLEELDNSTLFKPYATCLRMSKLGYKSEAQKSLFVCYNDLQTYVDCLHEAMHTTYAEYEAINQLPGGTYKQINTNLLQLENEFYSTIRPKRNVKHGERPLESLTRSGIEYIEVRALDLDPYSALGINEEQIRFLDCFLLHCLLADSPDCNETEFFEVASNVNKVVESGREPDLMLEKESSPKNLQQWALELIEDVSYSACLLDNAHQSGCYHSSVQSQSEKIKNPELTSSGRILTEMKKDSLSFFEFSLKQSKIHHETLVGAKLDGKILQDLRKTSSESLTQQDKIEESDRISFDEFLRKWNKN